MPKTIAMALDAGELLGLIRSTARATDGVWHQKHNSFFPDAYLSLAAEFNQLFRHGARLIGTLFQPYDLEVLVGSGRTAAISAPVACLDFVSPAGRLSGGDHKTRPFVEERS
jgi:hypothetical protein